MEQVRAVLVAGGPATRMRPLAACLPKALLPFGDTNLLALHLRALAEHGIRRATIIAGHLADRIAAELPILAPAGLKVEFVVEPHPVGSGGCLRYLPSEEGPLLIIFADLLASMDYRALLKHHQKNHLLATLVVHPNDHPADSDLVELGPEGAVVALHRKPRSGRLLYRNLACAGVFVLEQQALSCLPPAGSADLVHDCIGPLVERGAAVGAYRTTEYLKDCGIPERYQRALDDFARGQVNARARSVPRPTLFLDRDGTINRHIGHLHLPEQLELLPGAAAAIRRLNTAGALAIVVTNQPVIARGLCTLADLERIHAKLEMMLGEEGGIPRRPVRLPAPPRPWISR